MNLSHLRCLALAMVTGGLAVLLHADSLNRTSEGWSRHDPSVGPLDGRHLAIIINENDPYSVAIGGYYQRARAIPEEQVIRVRFTTSIQAISAREFRRIKQEVDHQTPNHVQIYALAWKEPYQVGCLSITTAFTFGYDTSYCADGCHTTRVSPYHARGDVERPWNDLSIRPAMLLAAADGKEARKLIDRGIKADGTSPSGTAYLVSTSDRIRNVRAKRYDFVQRSVRGQFKVRVIQSDALVGANDVMAYFTGLAFVPGIKTNRFLPGAVADHLTSFGGKLIGSSQMSILSWIDAGVTGSYGTVVEPCSYSSKFPDPALLLAYYLRGDTLIESYWRSVAMPGQGLFVGEPLARPWPIRK